MISQLRGAADTTIARLEIRADRADPLAARLAVEHLLGTIELRPAGLPPPAILCVRELRDPRPGTVSLASRPLRAPPVWEQAVRREVDRLARAAARPAHGAVPASAEAVVFADESELLACLGSDLVAGVVGARWWWRLLVDGIAQPRRAAVQAWLQAPAHAPAALQALAERGEAEAFVRMLDDRDARDLGAAIARAFALPAVRSGAGAARPSDPAIAPLAPPRAPVVFAAAARARAAASSAPPAIVAPWSTVAPEADQAGLSIEQRALLGPVLAIARAPSLARSAGFAIELAAWHVAVASPPGPRTATAAERAPWAARATPSIVQPPVTRSDTAERAAPATSATPATGSAALSGPAAMRLTPRSEASGARPAEQARQPPSGRLEPPRPPPSSPPAAVPAIEDVSAPSPWLPGDPPPPADPPRGSPAASRKPPAPPRRSRAFGPPIHTRLGGVFYLINLALYLRLYGAGDDLPLPLWDLIALVGRALLGDAAADGDPVWALLAELAGRADDEPAGAGFSPPPDWRMPPAWLTPFAYGAVRHDARHGRLVIHHAEGFALVDIPAHRDLAAQLAAELAPYGSLACAPSTDATSVVPTAESAPDADTPLGRWLARLLPCLRARLRRVLEVDDAALPARLLVHAARVHASTTHVDVVLPLDTLPIEIRFAGLDRDPGWVPAAGRFLAFHFE